VIYRLYKIELPLGGEVTLGIVRKTFWLSMAGEMSGCAELMKKMKNK
jgi:hypothetical protein